MHEGEVEREDAPALSPPSITFPGFLPNSSSTYLRLSTPCSSCLGHVSYGASPYAGKRTATSLPADLALSTMVDANSKWPGSAGQVYPPPLVFRLIIRILLSKKNGGNRKTEMVLFSGGREGNHTMIPNNHILALRISDPVRFHSTFESLASGFETFLLGIGWVGGSKRCC